MADRVTAIIPTYNRHDLLISRSLPSVMRQTVPVDEILIMVDGEDHDSFVKLCRLLPPDRRIRVDNVPRPDYPEDRGAFWAIQGYRARNEGLGLATGNWVAPLDDDDEWTDDHIELLLSAVNDTGMDFAYGKAVTPWGQWYGHWPPSGMNFTDGSQLYRHDMGYRYDPKSLERSLPTDADLWSRMIAGGVTFTFVNKLVHRYYPAKR